MTNAGREPAASLAYADAGVSIDAGNDFVEALKPLVRTTRRPGADAELGGFGGLFDLKKTGFRDPLLVSATDGVGTKLKIAIDTGILDTVGIDLVAMNVNDIIAQGAEPLFFLDYFATGRVQSKSAVAVVSGIAEGCRQAGCALIGGETAEMPGIYEPQEFDLAGFSVGAVERDRVLPRDVAAGDVILGLASSGVHSNGFSLVRLVAERASLTFDSPSPFSDGPLGRALLTPTRIYVKPLLAAMKEPGQVKALAHITGGGFVDNIPRVLPAGLAARIDLGAVAVPPVFRWVANAGPVSEAEMLRTFNCGVGMVVVVAADAAETVAKTLAAEGETVFRLGAIEPRAGDPVVFDGTLDVTFG